MKAWAIKDLHIETVLYVKNILDLLYKAGQSRRNKGGGDPNGSNPIIPLHTIVNQ